MVNLASGLVASGKRVDFVLVRAEGEFMADVPPGARVIDLQVSRAMAALPALIHYLRAERPEVLLAVLDHANVIAVWAKFLSRVTTCVVLSVHHPLSLAHGRASTVFGKVFRQLIQWTYPRADAVVAVSEGVRRDLIRYFGIEADKVHTIHNPIIHLRLHEMGCGEISHRWFGLPQVPVIIAVGRLAVEKDYPTLIRAFYLLRQKRSARLLILGEGSERAGLQALVAELGLGQDVELAGFAANPYAFMRQSAAYALTSTFEGFGNVIVEALALGCRVVCTDCPTGPTEILHGGEFGRLVPVGDSVAMAEALLQAVEEGSLPQTKSLARHLQQFEIPDVTAKYLHLFADMTS
jgi:glycosyltransferase involved in cell wall biosynthesis